MIDLIDVTAGYRNRPIIKKLFPSVGTGQFCRPHWPQWGGKKYAAAGYGRPFADQPRNAPS